MEFSSNAIAYLGVVAVRSLGLAALAAAALFVFRLQAAAVRHAVWTVVVAGMLALAAIAPLTPAVPIRVLRAMPAPAAVALSPDYASAVESGGAARRGAAAPATSLPHWRDAAVAVYAVGLLVMLIRLAFGYAFTVRLVRGSRKIERAWAAGIYESGWISVPLTVGWLRPEILLPADWEQWDAAKLEAVLAHERTHVRRADWAISVLAGLNRCVFWFHPLAWWLERRLASLAEQACDDSALLEVATEPYAQALLDMAAAVKTWHGRLVWEAMAMAKASEVRKRIERILDETRQIPKGLTGRRWAALVACSLPLIYLAAALRPVPAVAQQAVPAAAAPQAAPSQPPRKGSRQQLNAGDVPALEQSLAANPHDLDARFRLISYYHEAGMREPRMNHTYWLIANHPESAAARSSSQLISANDSADFQRAAAMWKQQAAAHPNDPRVLVNAGSFLSEAGGDFDEAERLLLAGRAIEPSDATSAMWLGRLYGTAILSTSGDPAFPNPNPGFAQRARTKVESTSDRRLAIQTAMRIISSAARPDPGRPLAPGVLNLDEHPLLVPLIEWAKTSLLQVPPGSVVRTGQMQAALPPPPPGLITGLEPVYPPLARQARVSGDVHLSLTIGSDGHVEHIEVESGHPLLVPAAMEAARQWVFSSGGAGVLHTVVPFRLDDGSTPVAHGVLGGIVGQAPAPLASAADGIPTVKIGGSVQAAKLISKVDPEYPPLAMQARISGVVHLNVLIGANGRMENLEVISGHPLLVPAALQAANQYVYAPTLFNGQPVKVSTLVDVDFTLTQ